MYIVMSSCEYCSFSWQVIIWYWPTLHPVQDSEMVLLFRPTDLIDSIMRLSRHYQVFIQSCNFQIAWMAEMRSTAGTAWLWTEPMWAAGSGSFAAEISPSVWRAPGCATERRWDPESEIENLLCRVNKSNWRNWIHSHGDFNQFYMKTLNFSLLLQFDWMDEN